MSAAMAASSSEFMQTLDNRYRAQDQRFARIFNLCWLFFRPPGEKTTNKQKKIKYHSSRSDQEYKVARNLAHPARRKRIECRPANIRYSQDCADAAWYRPGRTRRRGIHAPAVTDCHIAVSARQSERS